jgi:hypothetical protein
MEKYKLFNPLSITEMLLIAIDSPEAQYNPKDHLPKEEMVEFLTRANPVRGINVADVHLLF